MSGRSDEGETETGAEERGSGSARARLLSEVERGRRWLARERARLALRRRAPWLLALAVVLGSSRAWVWPGEELGPLALMFWGSARAMLLAVVGFLAGAATLYAFARRRPAALRAARFLDVQLGRPALLASALELETRDGVAYELLRRQVHAALGTSPTLPVLPSLRPSRRFVVAAALSGLAVLVVGAIDPATLRILRDPPSASEVVAAAELRDAAEDVAAAFAAADLGSNLPASGDESASREERETRGAETTAPGESQATQDAQRMAERAAALQRAMARADRALAERELSALREMAEDRRGRERTQDAALRRLARALAEAGDVAADDPSGARPPGEPRRPGHGSGTEGAARRPPGGESAADRMRLLARRLRESGEGEGEAARHERERVLERLARAAAEARRSGRGGEPLARALEAASENLTAGERAEAAEALERAAARSEELREARDRRERAMEALTRLLERAGRTERAMRLARLGLGEEGMDLGLPMPGSGEGAGQGEGEGSGASPGRGLGEALAARLAALELAEQAARGASLRGSRASARAGSGPEGPGSDRPGPRSEVDGRFADEQASSSLREGERAVIALEGLGAQGEATTSYRELFPGYGAVVEESLGSEDVPAARRPVVRRYFESIRPGQVTALADDSAASPAGPTEEE